MKTVAIICEYNPFHNGHQHHIIEARKKTGADYVIALMSGNYVQRGTPAIMEKSLRTKAALSCGADLVIELPLWFATGSAPYFATGAISMLNELGIVDYLAFGSELDDIEQLKDLATFLYQNQGAIEKKTGEQLKNGVSYPKARELALHEFNISKESLKILQEPNNILAIEYLKALLFTNSSISPVAIKRKESAHHEDTLGSGISSATSIRNIIEASDNLDSTLSEIPAELHNLMKDAYKKDYPVHVDDFSLLLKYQLLSNASFKDFWEISEDFEATIIKYATPTFSFTNYIDCCKGKNITWSRISRNLLHIMLGMKDQHRQIILQHNYHLYYQILGFRKEASSLIKLCKEHSTLPMIRHCRPLKDTLSPALLELLSVERKANQLYDLILAEKYHTFKKSNQIIV